MQGYGQYGGGGFQQPQQTGFGMGGMGMGMGMLPQPTGFPQQPQPQPQQQQPMQTGFQPQQQQQQQRPNQPSFLSQPPPSSFRPQPTGMSGMSMGGMSGLAPQMTGFPGGGASGLLPQQTGYPGGGGLMSQPTGFGGGGLMPQATGMGMLRAQPTGFHDPRLQTMMQSFMPSNMSQPFAPSGAPQFGQTPNQQPLAQTFQSLLNNPSVKTPKVPWVLTKQEKKDYDQIFRAWDTKGDGFIPGEMAREVFGQSGLGQDDLMKIWNLSDVDNRGKLNLPEFHVAMGLIYRALNGNEIPDVLPEELVPASMRDIDTTVNFMRDLLKHESSTRSSTASSPAFGLSGTASKDATMYKHDDDRPTTYKPSSRHLDRKSVRYAGEDSGAEITDLRRQLQSSSARLDQSNDDYQRKSAEDEELEAEVEDIKYRVRRIQEDIDYVSKGRKTAEKDEERRKLERELLYLMHEKLPEIERRQQMREEEKRRDERAGTRARDRRNETHGRYGRDDRDDRDRDWLRGSYDRRDSRERERDRERDREFYRDDRYDRERDRDRRDDGYGRSRDRSRDRDYDRPRSPPDVRTPPPAPPPAARAAPAPPAPPAPTSQAAAAPSTKNMTADERAAFIREQAAKRIQDRLRALGVEPAQETPVVDKSVEERLEREKKEAEERSQNAEQEQAKREEARRARLAGVGSTKEDEPAPQPPKAPSAPSSPAAPLKSAMKKPAAPPPAPPSRGKAPPPAPVSRGATVAPPNAASAPKPPTVPPPTEDPEEAELRAREEARQRSIAERKARLAQMEKEEEEERQREEAILAARRDRASVSTPSVASPPPAPPAPPPPSAPAHTEGGSYNPFRKPGAASTPAAAPSGGFNPFFKPQGAAAAAQSPSPAATPSEPPAAPPAPPAPPAAPPAPPFAPAQRSTPKPVEEDWDVIQEKEDSDSSDSDDDDYAHSRDKRGALASALFGGILGGGGGSPTTSRPGSAAPQPPAAPPAPKAAPPALANLGGGDAKTGMGALLGAIQGGARLRKATTVDKSIAPGAGAVIGDAAPPAHISTAPSLPSPTRESAPSFPTPPPQEVPSAPPAAEYAPLEDEAPARNANRQSVDWYAGLAADAAHPPYESGLASTKEEEEPVSNGHAGGVPEVKVNDEDELDQFDMTNTLRVRTLYPYDGQREVDLSFKENLVIEAHPSKDPAGEWWYGSLVDTGSKGWFPHSYVEELHPVQAKALYPYEGTTPEELPFMADDVLTIVDQSDPDWWKTVKAGAIFLVPASYLELMGSHAPSEEASGPTSSPAVISFQPAPASDEPHPPRPPSDLLSPTIPYDSNKNRSRSSTLVSDDYDDDASSSSGDSILSFWTSDSDSDSETEVEDETDAPPKPKAKPPLVEDKDKEAEKKRREEERSRMMSAAGLQLRREPPGIPSRADRRVSRRRAPPAPGAKTKRTAPAVPDRSHKSSSRHAERPDGEQAEVDTVVETHDAYTRYEQYLASLSAAPPSQATPTPLAPVHSGPLPSGPRPARPRANSRPLSTLSAQHTGASGSSPLSPSPTTSSLPQLGQGRLTGFLSRMMAPSNSSDRRSPAPAISGPVITRVDTPLSPDMSASASLSSAPTGASPGDFGKTWSSLVDKEVVDSMGDRERKRQEAIFEFIATEGAYNRDLQVVVEVFYASMLELLDEKALTVIFANIEDLLLSNMGFFSALEQRQKACRLYVDVVGDVLGEWMPRMQGYMTYCVNQAQAARLLQSLRSTNPALQQHLQHIRETNSSVRGLDLSSFLLIPMQRITRYPLLIKQIIHYTTPDQDLPALQDALNAVEGIVARINEGVREAESYERLKILSEDLWVGGEGRLDLTAPTAHLGPRRLLREGTVTKAKSGRKLTLVLCNDILVLIDSRNLYRMPIPLHELSVRPASRGEESFVVKVEYHRGGDTIALRASSPKDAKEWVRIIGLASRHAVEARRENDRRVLAGMEYPM